MNDDVLQVGARIEAEIPERMLGEIVEILRCDERGDTERMLVQLDSGERVEVSVSEVTDFLGLAPDASRRGLSRSADGPSATRGVGSVSKRKCPGSA